MGEVLPVMLLKEPRGHKLQTLLAPSLKEPGPHGLIVGVTVGEGEGEGDGDNDMVGEGEGEGEGEKDGCPCAGGVCMASASAQINRAGRSMLISAAG